MGASVGGQAGLALDFVPLHVLGLYNRDLSSPCLPSTPPSEGHSCLLTNLLSWSRPKAQYSLLPHSEAQNEEASEASPFFLTLKLSAPFRSHSCVVFPGGDLGRVDLVCFCCPPSPPPAAAAKRPHLPLHSLSADVSGFRPTGTAMTSHSSFTQRSSLYSHLPLETSYILLCISCIPTALLLHNSTSPAFMLCLK